MPALLALRDDVRMFSAFSASTSRCGTSLAPPVAAVRTEVSSSWRLSTVSLERPSSDSCVLRLVVEPTVALMAMMKPPMACLIDVAALARAGASLGWDRFLQLAANLLGRARQLGPVLGIGASAAGLDLAEGDGDAGGLDLAGGVLDLRKGLVALLHRRRQRGDGVLDRLQGGRYGPRHGGQLELVAGVLGVAADGRADLDQLPRPRRHRAGGLDQLLRARVAREADRRPHVAQGLAGRLDEGRLHGHLGRLCQRYRGRCQLLRGNDGVSPLHGIASTRG